MWNPKWRVTLVDRNFHDKRELDGILSHSIDLAATERLGGNAQLTLRASAAEQIDFLTDMVRFEYRRTADATWVPFGLFLLTSPKETYASETVLSLDVDCLHLPARVDRVIPTKGQVLKKGTKIIPWVTSLLVDEAKIPRDRIAATDTGITAQNERVFDPKDTILTIVNDVLTASAYWSLRANVQGIFEVKPWVAPAERVVAYEFTKGPEGVTKAAWTRSQDLSSVPNRVVVATSGDEKTAAIVGSAELTDPDHPLSIPNRGIVAKSYDVEANTQAAANKLAQQRLTTALDKVLHVEVEHAIVAVEPNDAVEYEIGGELEKFTVQRLSIGGGFNAHMKATWRGVTGNELQEVDGDTE